MSLGTALHGEDAAGSFGGVAWPSFARQLLWDPVGVTDQRRLGVLATLPVPDQLATRVFLAAGLPEVASDDLMREDDAELLGLVGAALAAGLPETAVLRCLRVFGASVRRIVETLRDISRADVEGRLLATGLAYDEMLHQSIPVRHELQRLSCRAVFLLQRRFLEQAAFANVTARIKEALVTSEMQPVSGGEQSAIAFADLAGFTRLTDEAGDTVAAERATAFEELAQEWSGRHGGRLVKSPGDGVMLAFADPRAAVAGILGLAAAAASSGLPPIRAGVACGPAVRRNGDLFGHTVNVAARLAEYARPQELLATHEVVAAADETAAAAFRPLGPVLLKGLAELLTLYAMQVGVLDGSHAERGPTADDTSDTVFEGNGAV